jgi:hypothetical protein
MCKLLVGLVFLVILALELFFNNLALGWLHTVRLVFWGLAWVNSGQVGRWGLIVVCFWSVFGLTRNPSISLVLADNLKSHCLSKRYHGNALWCVIWTLGYQNCLRA